MSIQYFALNVNSGLVYAVGEILAVTADCFLNEKSGHHILKVTNTNNHSLFLYEVAYVLAEIINI